MDDTYFDGFIDDEDSPYPEVRASVSNIDDPEMPCLTFRSWFLGLFFTITISAINGFFSLRYPAPFFSAVIVQVISYPCGKLLAWILPATEWNTPRFLRQLGFSSTFSFNPGPFNIKEHTIILVMANAATSPGIGITFSLTSEKFYGIRHGAGFDCMLMLSGQLVGFGMAGLARRFLVAPASLVWPQNLVLCTLLNVLHAEEDDGKTGGVSRFRFFLYVLAGAFTWYFLPGESQAHLSRSLFILNDRMFSCPSQASSSRLYQSSPSFVGLHLVSVATE